jgi:hypothetical protein
MPGGVAYLDAVGPLTKGQVPGKYADGLVRLKRLAEVGAATP